MLVFSFLGVSAVLFSRVWAVGELDKPMVSITNGETTLHLGWTKTIGKLKINNEIEMPKDCFYTVVVRLGEI